MYAGQQILKDAPALLQEKAPRLWDQFVRPRTLKQPFGIQDIIKRPFTGEDLIGKGIRAGIAPSEDILAGMTSKEKGVISNILQRLASEGGFADLPTRKEIAALAAKEGKTVAQFIKEGGVAKIAAAISKTVAPKGVVSQFPEAVKESPETLPGFKEFLTPATTKGEVLSKILALEDYKKIHTVVTDQEVQRLAKSMVGKDPAQAQLFALDPKRIDKPSAAVGIELLRYYQDRGDFESALAILDPLSDKFTKAGQTVQAAKLYAHLKPEAVLLKAQKIINQANKSRWAWQKQLNLDESTARQLSELSKQAQGATGDLQLELQEQIQSTLQQLKPTSFLQRVESTQTIAQLLNPKTLVRNIMGNEIFWRIDRLSHYVATPIDWARSKITGGERYITFKSAKTGQWWESWFKGAKPFSKGIAKGGKQALEGTSRHGTKFSLRAPSFKSRWNPMRYLEKAMSVGLRSFDTAAYERARTQTINELAYLKALNEGLKGKALNEAAKRYATGVNESILQTAEKYGTYAIYEDDNVLSLGFGKLKNVLNLGKPFGIGSMTTKYPRIPGALIMRALEYSPAGFLKSAYQIAKPFAKYGKEGTGKIPVREIELALSRAIVGTLGFTGMGYFLARKGIITGERDPNRRVYAFERELGGGQYQVEIDKLTRWVRSGFKEEALAPQIGDRKYTYDWAQPLAVSLSIGANMQQNVERNALEEEKKGIFAGTPGVVATSIAGGIKTLTEQPLVSGVQKLFSKKDPVEGLVEVIAGMPSSFVPTALNQVGQLEDNVQLETYDQSIFKKALKMAKAKMPKIIRKRLPGQELPKRYTVFGEEKKRFEKPSAFNVMFNPGFVSTFNPTPAAQMVLEIYNATGETKQMPLIAPRRLTFYGKEFPLDGQRISTFQRNIGETTQRAFEKLAEHKGFGKLDNFEKANKLNLILSNIFEAEKFAILTKQERQFLWKNISPKQQKNLMMRLRRATQWQSPERRKAKKDISELIVPPRTSNVLAGNLG
jgi:hypothetical protein